MARRRDDPPTLKRGDDGLEATGDGVHFYYRDELEFLNALVKVEDPKRRMLWYWMYMMEVFDGVS